MITMYYISWSDRIEKREVLSETPHFVVTQNTLYDGLKRSQRQAKNNDWFPTWKAAKQELIDRLSKRLIIAQRDVEIYTKQIALANALEEPS